MSPPLRAPTKLRANPTVREILAHNIRRLRVELGLSQEDLALRCDLDRTYVSAVERCRWNVALANIERMAKELAVEPWELLRRPQE